LGSGIKSANVGDAHRLRRRCFNTDRRRQSGNVTGTTLAKFGLARRLAVFDRQTIETVLLRRFPGATREQVAVSANALMGLNEEWEEVPYPDFAALAALRAEGEEFRVLRRRAL
jgi:hypothetical protein